MLSFVAYFEALLQLLLNLCQLTQYTLKIEDKNFLKNAYSAFFSILKHSYL